MRALLPVVALGRRLCERRLIEVIGINLLLGKNRSGDKGSQPARSIKNLKKLTLHLAGLRSKSDATR